MLVPSALRPGDTIRVIAPSSPCDRLLILRGLGWLSRHYRVLWSNDLFSRHGYVAGDDNRRLSELTRALVEPNVRAILAVRGGYGSTRIESDIDFSSLRNHPRWLVGFSDITALHLRAQSAGVCSMHAAHLGELGRGNHTLRNAWRVALERPTQCRIWNNLEILQPGLAAGPLVGGNLALLYDRAAAGKLRLPDGCLLFLEEVHEAPYSLDRMLTALTVGGHFRYVSGFVLGDMTGCHPTTQAMQTMAQCLTPLGVPIVAGLPVGHGLRNEPLPLGLPAVVNATAGRLTLCPN